MSRLAAVLLMLFSVESAAHDADVVYAQLELHADSLTEIVTLTGDSLVRLAPIDLDHDGLITDAELVAGAAAISAGIWDDMPLRAGGVPCSRSDERSRLEAGFIALSARFRCGDGDLRQDFKVLRVLPSNYRVVLGSQLDGERGKRFAQGVFTALEVPRPVRTGRFDGERLERGFRRGLSELGRLEGLALLALVMLFVSSSRWLAARSVLFVVAGTVTAAFVHDVSAVVATALSLAGLAAGFLEGTRPRQVMGLVATALCASGLSMRVAPMEEGGFALALGLLVVIAALLAIPAGRLLSRRPEARSVARLGLALAAAIACISRLAG